MNDLISRQVAIDEIEYELKMINSALDSITLDFNARERLRQRKGEAREILNSIQQLPSAQAQQKNGKWEVIDEVPPRRYGCSICKKLSWYQYNYCPNCGAYMETDK